MLSNWLLSRLDGAADTALRCLLIDGELRAVVDADDDDVSDEVSCSKPAAPYQGIPFLEYRGRDAFDEVAEFCRLKEGAGRRL